MAGRDSKRPRNILLMMAPHDKHEAQAVLRVGSIHRKRREQEEKPRERCARVRDVQK
jgi:hypothetical protein